MNELDDFIKVPDENLEGSTTATGNPPVDFFNSAANTNLEEDGDTEETGEATGEEKVKIKGKVVLGKLISGKATVNLVNIFIPSFIVFALNRFGYKISKQQMKLTGEEKEILAPVIQDCLNYIEIDFDNPYYTLAFVATMIYGSKILDVMPELKKIKEDTTEDTGEEKEKVFEYKENKMKEESETLVKGEYIAIREKIDSTSIRKEKNKIIVEAIAAKSPKDLIEMFKIYGSIFPERNEGYFRKFYDTNYDIFPEHLKFNSGE